MKSAMQMHQNIEKLSLPSGKPTWKHWITWDTIFCLFQVSDCISILWMMLEHEYIFLKMSVLNEIWIRISCSHGNQHFGAFHSPSACRYFEVSNDNEQLSLKIFTNKIYIVNAVHPIGVNGLLRVKLLVPFSVLFVSSWQMEKITMSSVH